jgi:hypothetical protein
VYIQSTIFGFNGGLPHLVINMAVPVQFFI